MSGISREAFARRYPALYHMAEDQTWDTLQQHGLLSCTALLDLFEVSGDARTAIESSRRPRSVELAHPEHGRAVIRDNKPFQEGRMRDRLVGMTMREWYEHLNRRTFFWVSESRLARLLNAYGERPHIVLTVDTASLLEQHEDAVTLARMNTGATNFVPPMRGVGTFMPLSTYPFDELKARTSEPVVELTVDYSVPDIAAHVLRVERRQRDQVLEVLVP